MSSMITTTPALRFVRRNPRRRFHTRSINEATGNIVLKNFNDLVAPVAGILAAARFLRVQTITLDGLFHVANAAIDDRLFVGGVRHCPYQL